MSLKTFPEMEQRSASWYEARCGIVTASTVGQLITPSTLKVASNPDSRGLTASLLAERITNEVEETYVSADMQRGIDHEPIARMRYAARNKVDVASVGFMVRDDWGFSLGYSPDGLIADDGLLEIKCPRAKTHVQTILLDEVPSAHMAKLQAGLLVSGREWIDFVSFCAGLPLWTKRVTADPKWQAVIVDAVRAFEVAAEAMAEAYLVRVATLPATDPILDITDWSLPR